MNVRFANTQRRAWVRLFTCPRLVIVRCSLNWLSARMSSISLTNTIRSGVSGLANLKKMMCDECEQIKVDVQYDSKHVKKAALLQTNNCTENHLL